MLWDALSAALRAAVVCILGYSFGRDAAEIIDRIGTGTSTAVAAIIIGVVAWRLLRRRQSDPRDGGETRSGPHRRKDAGNG